MELESYLSGPFWTHVLLLLKSKERKEWQEEQQAHSKELQPTFRSTSEAGLQWQRVGYKSSVLEKKNAGPSRKAYIYFCYELLKLQIGNEHNLKMKRSLDITTMIS